MTTLEKLKASLMRVRKARGKTSFVSFVIAECEKPGKSKGNRESTEDEVQAVLKKLISNNWISVSNVKSETAHADLLKEINFLESFRPELVDENALRAFIMNLKEDNIGKIMGAVKAEFGAAVDMKLASQIAKN